MFSKNKPSETKQNSTEIPAKPDALNPVNSPVKTPMNEPLKAAPKAKPAPSYISTDLKIIGDIATSGDIQIEGKVDGNIRAHLLTVGQSATINGEVVGDDVVVNGNIIGSVRGLKVRLTSTAHVKGDIIHKTIAIESGAHFEGSVQRADDPLGSNAKANPEPKNK